MPSSFCFKFQISLSLIDSHSFLSYLENNELPTVFTAKGNPSHFSMISFPISNSSGCFFSSPSSKANFTNSERESFSERHPRRYKFDDLVRIMTATAWLRVVTRTLLPLTPTSIISFNSCHRAGSSFHTSSNISKNFLPSSFFLRRF
ncbi:hypothetical protein V8G54_029205 [Vigna mungo]|uniref:Uncharacterized protein n=1 Tax=Vigna mungo TaxID=3915 RepID=A0AAQ3MUE8_VIGMU